MQVKCPRCRFHFYSALTPGFTTLQCFCPRCGQPFFYDLTGMPDLQDGQSVENMPAFGPGLPTDAEAWEAERRVQGDRRETGNGKDVDASGTDEPQTGSDSATSRSDGQRSGSDARRWNEAPLSTDSRLWGEARPRGGAPNARLSMGCVVGIAVIVIGSLICAYQMMDSDTPFPPLDEEEITDLVRRQERYGSYSRTDNDDTPADTLPGWAEDNDEAVPDWVEGSWHIYTDYGGIDVTISGHTITETTDGETCKGTFRYHANALYCDFGDDDKPTVYRLDRDHRYIDAGNGLLMQRME